MAKVIKKDIEYINQELITVSELISYIIENKNYDNWIESEKELSFLLNEKERLLNERKKLRKKNKTKKVDKKRIKKIANQKANLWLNQLNDLVKKGKN